LGVLANTYLLDRDGTSMRVGITELTRDQVTVSPLSGDITPSEVAVDLTARWTLPLPAPQLRPAGGR